VCKGDTEVALRRKPFAILRYLLANPRRLVTHDELIGSRRRSSARSRPRA